MKQRIEDGTDGDDTTLQEQDSRKCLISHPMRASGH